MTTPSLFRHYKGGTYRRLGLVKQEADWDDLVEYECLDDPEPRDRITRPAHEFYGFVSASGRACSSSEPGALRRFAPLSSGLW